MLTIHNMDNTASGGESSSVAATGLNGEDFNTLEKAMDELNHRAQPGADVPPEGRHRVPTTSRR